MTGPADARLQRLLGGEHLASLRRRLRRRFERAPPGGAVEFIRVGGLTAEEHAVLASLLGRAQRYSNSLQIDVSLVDAVLQRSGLAVSLRDALEQLDGPIANLAATRHRLETLWSGVMAERDHPDLIRFLHAPEGGGLLKRLAKRDPSVAAELCRRGEAVLRHLPTKGIARSQLAADVLGDAHALDSGEPVATLVLAVLRRLNPGAGADEDRLTDETPDAQPQIERTREIWASAGVLVNELARPALLLNVPTKAGEGGWRRGEPTYLSLRSLLRSPPPWNVAGHEVHVCENPNLVAIAADRWNEDCAPLVCTDGMPAAAQRCLLFQLAKAGARLCYHGDFDWPGLRIGNHVMRQYGAVPWRFGASDYMAAVRIAPRLARPLTGKPVDASWDGALAAAMQEHRISIAEEAVAASLLQDLADPAPRAPVTTASPRGEDVHSISSPRSTAE